MESLDLAARLGPAFAAAFAERGYTTLTSVQEAALDPDVASCDLRISSQTGSGKTVAIGFALRSHVDGDVTPGDGGVARPAALVIVPTRELARQVEQELAWLYAKEGRRVASVTGGASYRDERRALGAGPAIVVGTPGRLLDQLSRGAIDPEGVRAVALDEADRMLDMGFRDDIEAIFEQVPEGRRTHLVSATFPRDVLALADALQTEPVMIEGTPLGVANADIDHVIHMVLPPERTDAIVNLLLARPGAQTLIFARTRADVAELAATLSDLGFAVSALSGEMEQRERNRALAAFKNGDLDALVATDVAARGIDVQDVTRVIHAEPPSDADSYTHRSGRTGRAGRKGTSTVLVPPAGLSRATFLLRRAGVQGRVEPLPTADAILDARDAIVVSDLTGDADLAAVPDERTMELARTIASSGQAERAIARLLAQRFARRITPRPVTPITARTPNTGRAPEPRKERERPQQQTRSRPPPPPGGEGWVTFRVSWGEAHGADARRMLAMACRRGGIQGSDIGSIRISKVFSTIDVAERVAASFAEAAGQPDPRDPRVKITRYEEGARPRPGRPTAPERPVRPERTEWAARPHLPARIERPAPQERPERPHRPERSTPQERPERPHRPERSARPERTERPARPERAERPERAASRPGPRPAARDVPKRGRGGRPGGASTPKRHRG